MPESNPTETSAPMATQAGAARSIVVKFKENLTLPYVDELEEMLPSLQLMGWDAIAKLTAGSSFRRILRGFSPQNTRAIFDLAQKMNPKLQAKSVALFHHFVIEAVPEALAKEVLAALRSWPAVEYAYFAPTTVPAPTITAPAIPQSQYYLNAAPLGIDARYALQLPGGDGTGQQIVDVEAGWTLQHQGLLDAAGAPFVQLIGTLNNPSNASHGTGVLGILCGNNRCGVLGIAHHLASAAVVGHDGVSGASVHRAIELAILSLMPGIDPTRLGDPGYLNELVNAPTLPQVPGGPVLLIEVQVGRPSDPNYGMPVEIDPVVAGLLEIATAIGIVVVEAAGNGGHDLDAYPDECRGSTDRILNLNFPGEFRDTGAIMVGCGAMGEE